MLITSAYLIYIYGEECLMITLPTAISEIVIMITVLTKSKFLISKGGTESSNKKTKRIKRMCCSIS